MQRLKVRKPNQEEKGRGRHRYFPPAASFNLSATLSESGITVGSARL